MLGIREKVLAECCCYHHSLEPLFELSRSTEITGANHSRVNLERDLFYVTGARSVALF